MLRALASLAQVLAHELQPGGVHKDFQSSRVLIEAEVLVQVPRGLDTDATYVLQPCCAKLWWKAGDRVPKVGLRRVIEAASQHEVVYCICIGPFLLSAVFLSHAVKAKPEAHGNVDSLVYDIDFQI